MNQLPVPTTLFVVDIHIHFDRAGTGGSFDLDTASGRLNIKHLFFSFAPCESHQ